MYFTTRPPQPPLLVLSHPRVARGEFKKEKETVSPCVGVGTLVDLYERRVRDEHTVPGPATGAASCANRLEEYADVAALCLQS